MIAVCAPRPRTQPNQADHEETDDGQGEARDVGENSKNLPHREAPIDSFGRKRPLFSVDCFLEDCR